MKERKELELDPIFTTSFMSNVFFEILIKCVYLLKITGFSPDDSKELAGTIMAFSLENVPDIPVGYFKEETALKYICKINTIDVITPNKDKRDIVFFHLAYLDLYLFLLSKSRLAAKKMLSGPIAKLRHELGEYAGKNLNHLTWKEYHKTRNSISKLIAWFGFSFEEINLFESLKIHVAY